MKESDASLQRLVVERDEAERERWNILRHARDEAERGLAIAAQLNVREAQIQQMQQELLEVFEFARESPYIMVSIIA